MPIHTEIDSERRVGTVTIDRPDKRNALSRAMLAELRDAFETLPDAEADVRVLVVEGTDGIFSAGADIGEFQRRAGDPSAAAAYVEEIHRTYEAVEGCPLPVVAKIPGPAIGAGCEIALAADLRVASATAALVDTLAAKSPQALSATKRALRHAESVSKDESIAYRKQVEYECFDHPHFAESINAFVEGREPSYR